MSKKSKTTENSTTNTLSTSTPTVAPWLSSNYQGLGQQIADFSKTDPNSYVAGPSALQSQAFSQASGLGAGNDLLGRAGQAAQSLIGGGANLAPQAAQAGVSTYGGASLLDGGLDKYMNAGLNDAIDASLADYDYSAGRQTAAQKASQALNKAFNSDRSVFKEVELADALARGRAATSGQLRYDAFDRASALAAQDAQLRQQAGLANMGAYNQASMFNAGQTNQTGMFNAGQRDNYTAQQGQLAGLLGSLGDSQSANQRADLGLLGQLGGTQQELEQAKLNATPTFLQLQGILNGQIPIGAFTSTTDQGNGTKSGTSTTTKSDPLGSAGKIAQLAAMFSDVRLKENIVTEGYDAAGRRWTSYNYIWDDPSVRHRGVIAQEVARTDPDAVHRHESGYLMVDYSRLEA